MSNSTDRGPYRFPIDSHDQCNSRISFQAIEIIPPEFDMHFITPSSSREIAAQTMTSDPFAESRFKELAEGATGSFTSAHTPMKTAVLNSEKADLYLPINFTVNDTLNYDQNTALGAAGGAAAAALQSGQSMSQGMMAALEEGGKGITDFFRGIGGGDVSRLAAARGSQYIPVQGVRDAVGIAARITMNPNVRTKYNGVSIREFSFNFQFIPKSPQESQAVADIIRFFRFHAYPEEIPPGKSFSLAFNYPNMFKIRLLSENNGMIRHIGTPIKFAYLRTIQATYNPTTAVLHADGAPMEIALALSFVEFKPISRQDIRAEDDDVLFDGENASLNTLLNIGNQFSSQFGINLGGIPAFGQFNQALGQLGAVQGLVSQAQGFVSNVRSVFGGFF